MDADDQPEREPPSDDQDRSARLRELAILYLKLGTIAFGGPAAHVAMMEDEVVRRRRWLSREQFLDLLGAANLIPGPSSTELAIYIGLWRAGPAGLIVAGVCFILPAFLMVMGLAWLYVEYGNLPATSALLYGIKPVVIAIVLQALWRLGRGAVKTGWLAALGIACAALAFYGTSPIVLLLGSGLVAAALHGLNARRRRRHSTGQNSTLPGLPPLLLAAGAVNAAAPAVALWPLFAVFLKIGCVVFGSGYVLLIFLRDDLVTKLHWLTEAQLLDAVAIGQVTPGPVFTTATFIGYVLAGPAGAAVATLGIFLPAFLFVGLTGPLVRRLRASPTSAAFLDGVNVAAVALMAVVTYQLAGSALIDGLTVGIAVASCIALFRWQINSAWLVAAGAAIGLMAAWWGWL